MPEEIWALVIERIVCQCARPIKKKICSWKTNLQPSLQRIRFSQHVLCNLIAKLPPLSHFIHYNVQHVATLWMRSLYKNDRDSSEHAVMKSNDLWWPASTIENESLAFTQPEGCRRFSLVDKASERSKRLQFVMCGALLLLFEWQAVNPQGGFLFLFQRGLIYSSGCCEWRRKSSVRVQRLSVSHVWIRWVELGFNQEAVSIETGSSKSLGSMLRGGHTPEDIQEWKRSCICQLSGKL